MSVVDGREFLNQRSYVPSWLGVFQFCTFLNRVIFSSNEHFPFLLTIFHVANQLVLSVIFSLFPYLAPNWFSFFVIEVPVCDHAFFPLLAGRIIFRCFGILCFASIVLSNILNLLSLTSTFWLISSSCNSFVIVALRFTFPSN